jgi:hypothetical protein
LFIGVVAALVAGLLLETPEQQTCPLHAALVMLLE